MEEVVRDFMMVSIRRSVGELVVGVYHTFGPVVEAGVWYLAKLYSAERCESVPQ